MYRSCCSCQAVQLEIDGSSLNDLDVETLSCSDDKSFILEAHREEIVIDCEPSVLGSMQSTPGVKQYFCNLCSTHLFSENPHGKIQLQVNFYGHDLLSEHHGQFHLP